MASVRDYVRRRRVIRRRAVFRGERILVKHSFQNIITGAKWQDWCEGVVTQYNDFQIEVSFFTGEQYSFHPEDDYNLLKYTDDHYNPPPYETRMKLADVCLASCRTNGQSAFTAPEDAIEISSSSDEEDLDALD